MLEEIMEDCGGSITPSLRSPRNPSESQPTLGLLCTKLFTFGLIVFSSMMNAPHQHVPIKGEETCRTTSGNITIFPCPEHLTARVPSIHQQNETCFKNLILINPSLQQKQLCTARQLHSVSYNERRIWSSQRWKIARYFKLDPPKIWLVCSSTCWHLDAYWPLQEYAATQLLAFINPSVSLPPHYVAVVKIHLQGEAHMASNVVIS